MALTKLRALLVAVALAASFLVSTPEASAAVTTFNDAKNDAVKRFDLRRITLTNGSRVKVRVHVADLQGGLESFVAFFSKPGDVSQTYYAQTVHRSNGSVTAKLFGGGGRVDCDVSATWKVSRDFISVKMPRSCIDIPGKLRIYVALGAGNGNAGDPADFTRSVNVKAG